MKRGRLIAFEGVDGSGKTTQMARLAAALRGHGLEVVVTREPTDGHFGQRIRAMAGTGERPHPDEELRWFVEDRREHVKDTIAPALRRGAVVLTDRYFLSTVAYQGARGHDPEALLARSEAEFPVPDLVLLLEIPPARGIERVSRRGGDAEPSFEQRGYLERVDAIFRGIERDYVVRVEASADRDSVYAEVRRRVEERLGLPPHGTLHRAGEPPTDAGQDGSRLDAWLGPYLTDSLLWPVTIVAALALALFGSAILLLAVERNAFAWVVLLGLVAVTADGLRGDLRRRRLGPGGALVLGVWLLAILAAVVAASLGLF